MEFGQHLEHLFLRIILMILMIIMMMMINMMSVSKLKLWLDYAIILNYIPPLERHIILL